MKNEIKREVKRWIQEREIFPTRKELQRAFPEVPVRLLKSARDAMKPS